LSVIILTRDEELHLRTCVESLADLHAQIFVVDSGSSDRTQEIARELGCEVYQHPFESQAAQLNWAIDNLPVQAIWLLRMDADEWLTPQLAAEIAATLPLAAPDVAAFVMKRRVYFWGRWIRHGGYYPIWLMRLWRAGSARSEQRWMDEHLILTAPGKILQLNEDFVDENRKGLGFWTDKHNRYADREVKDTLSESSSDPRPAGQMGFRRWAKGNVYGRMPLFLRAFCYWFYRYFILFGFLDGRPGFVFHFLQAFWYRMLIDAKIYESTLQNATNDTGQASSPLRNSRRRSSPRRGS